MKLAVASSQFLRAQHLSSGLQMRSESELMITKQLKLNHYPDIVINEARTRASKPKRRRWTNPSSAFLKLPYKSDQVDYAVNKAIRKYKIPVRVVYENAGSLKRTSAQGTVPDMPDGGPGCLHAEKCGIRNKMQEMCTAIIMLVRRSDSLRPGWMSILETHEGGQ